MQTRPLDSRVFIDDSDSTPLISETFNFVTGCSYAIIARVSKAGVDKPFKTDGGFTESKYLGISFTALNQISLNQIVNKIQNQDWSSRC